MLLEYIMAIALSCCVTTEGSRSNAEYSCWGERNILMGDPDSSAEPSTFLQINTAITLAWGHRELRKNIQSQKSPNLVSKQNSQGYVKSHWALS